VATSFKLYKTISLFLASKMTLAKLRMFTPLEENMRNLGILSSNSTADLSSESYFLSPRIRKTSKH